MGNDEGEVFRFTPWAELRKRWRKELRELGLSGAEASDWCTGFERFRQKRNELVAARGGEPLPPQPKVSELKNEERKGRYHYAVETLGLSTDAALKASQSVKALVAAAPEGHVFPSRLLRRRVSKPTTEKGQERSLRYHALKALGMPATMASDGCGSLGAFERAKREWAQIRTLRAENDGGKERARG